MSTPKVKKKLHDWFKRYCNVNKGFVKRVNFTRVLYPYPSIQLAMQVPKLRELKSHSFPQTWGEEEDCSPPLCSSGRTGQDCSPPLCSSGQSADEKRRRWVHCQGYTQQDRWASMSVYQ